MKDLKGQRFGRLVVIKENGRINRRIAWLCKCDCGNEITLSSNRLLHKEGTKSCGCLRKEVAKGKATKHGLRYTPLYSVWESIKKRCNNPNCKSYKWYGAKGVKLCTEWEDFKTFYEWAINGYKEGLTIDRIDYEGNYEPNNCRWITQKEQLSNYSRNVIITVDGVTDTVQNICIKYNVPYDKVIRRIRKGMKPKEALTAIFKNGTNKIIGYKRLET